MPNAIIRKRMKTMGYGDEANVSKVHKNLQSGWIAAVRACLTDPKRALS